MHWSLTLLFFLGLLLDSYCQKRDLELFPFKKYSKTDTIEWQKYERPVSKDFRIKTIDYLTENFFNFIEDLPVDIQKDYRDHFHFIELNDDGFVDVLFEGWAGLHHKSTMLFINIDGDSFIRVFDAKEIAVGVGFANNKLNFITIMDFGNDMEYLVQEVRYEFDAELRSSIRYVRAYSLDTEFPSTFLGKPFLFRINTPLYTLRLNPEIDNQTRVLFLDEVRGNTVGVFRQGNLGYVWAEKKDADNQTWWFVEMLPVKNISQSIIYVRSSSLRVVGWMKAELLEKVK